jgi:hypothetical protein
MNIRAFGRLLFSGFALPKLAFRESNFLPEPKPKSLFEALRSKRFVRRMAVAMVLAMGAGLVALQANANPTLRGENSTIDRYLEVNPGATTNQYAQHPDTYFMGGQTNATYEAWIYPTNNSTRQPIFAKEASYIFGLDSGKLWSAVSNGVSWIDNVSDVSVPMNSWSHVAFIKIGTGIVIYLNGEEILYYPYGAYQTITDNSNPLTFGWRNQWERFNGRLDEIRIWTSDRRNQIAGNMHNKIAGSNSIGLHGYWDFNEPSGNTVFDRTTGAYIRDLTLVNSPTRADVKTLSAASNGDTVITFNRTYLPSSGNWTVPAAASRVRALVAAGGGGGGGYIDGGGGGAGGVVEYSSPSPLSGDVKITVGQGGNGGYNTYAGNNHGLMGQDSYLGTVRALGGGGGGGYGYEWNLAWAQGWSGGSGGGHAEYGGDIAPAAGTQRTDAVTYSGGTEYGNNGGSIYRATQAGSGGGGASSAGGNVTAFRVGGAGGSAMTSDISGTSASYAGGGGGGDRDGAGASGGSGVGGNGGGTAVPTNGAANTGSGGGGADGERGANGGSGVVIVRYTPATDRAVDLAGNINSLLTGPTGVIPSGAFTVESWVFLRSNASQTLFSEGVASPGSTVYLATLANGQVYVRWGGAEASTGVVAPTNRWVHFAFTRTAAGAPKFFIDGAEVWTSGSTSTLAPGAGIFKVGDQIGGGGAYLNGQVDQVKVWGVDLTAAELALSMHSYGANQSNGTAIRSGVTPRAHYDFNEFTDGGVEPDRSGNGRSLTHASAISTSSYTDAQIVETGTVFSSMQTYVEFNRTYLTATGGWTRPSAVSNYKVLAVAGGGGGGVRHGGGGGAGELLEATNLSLGTTVPIVVGQGGVGYPASGGSSGESRSGQDTVVGTITLKGGGGSNKQGGSGGGGGTGSTGQLSNRTNTNTAAQTYLGNGGGTGSQSGNWTGGGGGGAGSVGLGSIANTRGGIGGSGYVSSITGTRACYAAGGGGGAGPTASNGTGPGGSCADLASSTIGGVGGWRHDTAGTAGTANTGSGGGGGGFNDSGSPVNGASGSGGSGVVILSYGATMDVTQTPAAAVAGRNFIRAITVQLKNANGTNYTGADQQVTITSNSSSVLQQTIGATTTNITSTTTTSRNGIATFSGIGFQSGVSGAQTLAVTSDAFVGTTLSVTPAFLPTAVTISSASSSNGSFIEGLWISPTAGSSNIQASVLASELAARDVTVEVSGTASDTTSENGSILFQTSVTKTAGPDRTITLKANKNVYMDTFGISSTSSKLNMILWLDSDSTNGGQAILKGPASGYLVDTNGGHLAIGGGSGSTSWNGLSIPSGYTQANNSSGTSWWGIELGTNQSPSNLKLIRTSGGNLRLYGDTNSAAANTTALYGIAWEGGEINTGSGSVEFNGKTSRDTNPVGGANFGVGIGVNRGTGDVPQLVTTGSVTITGTTAGTYSGHQGVYVGYADFNLTTSTVSITSDRRLEFGPSNSFVSPVDVTSSANVLVSGTQTINGSSTATSLRLTSSGGNVVIQGSITAAGGVATSASGTTALEANVSAGAPGISIRSVGRITGNAGASAASPRLLGTAGGPITLWTTGTAGGVTLGNFTQLSTTQSSATGADITIGGGAALTADTSRPSGAASSNAEHGVQLGTTVNSSVFVVRAGTGAFSVSGAYTGTASTAKAGIWFPPGQDINAGTIEITGTTTYNQANDTTTSIDSYFSGSTAASLLHATRSFATSGDSIRITGSSASNTGMSLGPNINNPSPMTIRASGNNAGIAITGTSSSLSATSGLWMAGVALQTANGPVLLNSGARPIGLSSSLRTSSYAPISPSTGGNIRIVAGGIHASSSSAAFNVNTAGTLTLEPFETSFASAVTFPATDSSTSVGNLIVGTSGNTGDLTVGAAVTSASEVTYRGGSITVSGNVTSTNGTAAFYSTGASKSFSKTTATITAAQDVIISSAASTVSTGSGAISAATVRLSSSSTMTSGAPITSRGAVEISSSAGDTTVSGTTLAAGHMSVVGGAVTISATQTTTNSRNITITPRAAYSGAGRLSSDGNITISGGTNVDPTGPMQAVSNVVLRGSGQITTATNAAITSSGGSVSVTSTGGLIALGNAVVANSSITISPFGAYSGAGNLTAGTTLSITGGTTSAPTGTLRAGGNITLSSSAQTSLTTLVTSTGGDISVTAGPIATSPALNLAGATITTTSTRINLSGTGTGAYGIYASGSTRVQSSSGEITFTGVGATWGVGFSAAEVLSTTGAITIDGGTLGIVVGDGTTTTLGATASTSASGDITLIGDNYWGSSTAVNVKTSGTVLLRSAAQQFSGAITINNHTFSGHTSLTVGRSTNQRGVTMSGGSVSVVNDYVVYGGAVTQNSAVTSSAGSIAINPTGAYAGTGALTATSGTVRISGGTSVAPTGAIRALGDISLSGSAAVSNSTAPLTSTTGSVSVASTGTTVSLSGAVSASSSVTVRANTELTTSAAITSSTSRVSLASSTTSIRVDASVSAPEIEFTPKTTYQGSGSLTASAGTVRITGGTSVEPTGPIRATGDITLSGSAALTNSGASLTTTAGSIILTSTASTLNISAALSAPVNVTLTAHTSLTTSAAVTATNGTVTAESKTTSISIGGATSGRFVEILPETTYVGAGALTASAGTVRITGGSSISPTGAIRATSNVVLRGTGLITNATSATINSSSGSVEINSSAGAVSLTNNVTANGPVRIYGTEATINSNLQTTGGSSSEIRVKTTGRVLLESSKTLTTAGGDVVIWTAAGKVAGTTVVGTSVYINTNASIVTDGGKIWLAGGLDDGGADASITTSRGKWSSVVANDDLPDGYAVGANSSDAWAIGAYLESGTFLNSKGGDIFIAGAQGPTSSAGHGHIILNTGARVDSGVGRIAMWGRSLSGSTNWSQGILLNWVDNSSPVVISSNATTSDAITIYSDSQAGAPCARGITAWNFRSWSDTSAYQGAQILATGAGGGISLTGLGSTSTNTACGSGWGVDLEFADVLAISGPITVNAIGNSNGTTPGLATGWRGNAASIARFGAWAPSGTSAVGGASITTPGGLSANFSSSSSNVTINTTSAYSWEGGYGTVINTSGSVAIQPATVTNGVVSTATNFSRDQSAVHWRFGRFSTPTRMASFTLGREATSSDVTYAGTSSILTQGDVSMNGGNLSLSSSINSSSGAVYLTCTTGNATLDGAITAANLVKLDSSGTSALNANITSGSQGILVKSAGRITTSAGTNASTTRTISTSGGDITFWTTGANGGVGINNWALIESNGGDITFGGGAADTADTSRPASNSTSNSMSAVVLGTSNIENVVRIRSGAGDITVRGQGTRANNLDSGVGMMAGVKIIGGKVSIYGKNQATSTSNNTSAGVFFYENSGSARTLIEATNASSNQTKIETLSVVGETVAGDFAVMLGNSDSTGSVADQITLRTTGNLAGMRIDGTSGKSSGNGVWMAGAVMSTANGDVLLDSNSKEITLSRSGATRKVTYVPVAGQPGGDITIRSSGTDLVNNSQGFLEIETAGTLSFVPPSGQSFGSTQTFPFRASIIDVGGLIVGSSTNTQTVSAGAPVTSTGNITYLGGSFTQDSSAILTATSSGSTIRILADTSIGFSAGVRASNNGVVALETRTSGTGIRIEGTNASTMLVSAVQLETHLSTTTLRIGDRDRTGNVFINVSLNLTGDAQNLAIRSNANVSALSGVVVTVPNLGIDAGGTISFPGTGGAASVIALNAGGVTFNQSANYNVAVVDGIDPEFGFATKFVLSNVDRTNTVDRFMAVTFNPPPPAVVIQDKFNNPLASNNQSASGFVVRATLVSVPSDGVVRSLDGATGVRGGATHTFTNLRVMGGTGLVGISYTAERADGTLLADSQTGAASVRINYTIRAGEPASIDLAFSSTSTRAGLTGLSPTATLKDSTNGVLTTGEYKNATISLSITGTTGRIISGETSTTTDGVARFPNLVVAGTAGTEAYTLTFSVTFRDSSNVTKTVSRSQLISITAGTATKLSINTTSQTVTNRATLSDLALTVLDDYGNAAAFGSQTSIAATISAGTNRGLTPTLSGTTTRSTDSNTSVATFSGLSLSGTVDTYTITFASGSLASTTHTVRLTHGAAANLVVSAPSTAANDRNFGSNVVVDIVDADGNVVTSGSQSTQTITLSANTTLTGIRAISATAGRATFTGLRMLGTVGVKVLTSSISSPSSISTPTNITLGFGDATRVALTRQASGFVNRVEFPTQPVLSILDSSGNVVTNHSQSITVTRTAVDAAKPATFTGIRTILPSSGVVTFTNLRLDGKVGEFDLTFESGSLSSTTQRVTLTHGAVETVVVTGATTTSNARTFGSAIRVEIQDADANLVTTGTAASQSIALTASGATLSGTTTRSAVAGAVDFSGLVLTGTTGAKTLTATILNPATKTGTRTVTISHGAATQLVLTTSASQAVSRQNIATQPVIQVRDVSGNPVSDFVGRVSVAVSRASTGIPFSLTGTRVIDLNGSPTATFSGLGLYGEVGDFTLTYTGLDTAASQNLTSTSQSITLAHGTATNLLITSPSTARNSITLGSAITVEVRDQDNNRVTGNNAQVTLSVSDATISGTAQRNASNGLAIFGSLAFVGAEGDKTLTARLASPSLTEIKDLTITFGEATKLAIAQAASGAVNRANFSVQPIIQVQDVSGNVVDDYTSSVSIAVSRSASAVAFGLSGTGALNASAGVASFTGLGLFGATGDYTLTYSSGSLPATSQTLRLTHGVATQVKIIDGSTGVANGAPFGRSYATQIQDQDGNVVSTGSDATAIVTLTPSGATLTGTRSKASSSGTASFTDLVMTGVVGSKTITASTATFTSAPYAVNLTAGAATKIVLTTPASGFVNRVAFSTQPTVMIQDSSGNVVANHNQSITVTRTAVDPSKPATLTGDRTVAAGNGVVTFTNLRLEGKVGEFDLTFESGSLSSTTQRVTLTHGAATAVVLTGATTASNARTIATNIVAEIRDADANRVTTGSDSNQSIVMSATGAVLSGTNSVNASGGLATFSNLTLTATAGTKRLTATISSPSTITGIRDIELAHGEATQLVLTTSATGAVNRSAFTTQPVVSVRDVSGNPVSDFVGRVSVALTSAGSNSAVISGTAYRDLNGSPTATFTGLGLNGDVGDYTLIFTHSTLTAPSQSITLAHGSANYLSISSPASASNSQTLGTAIDVDIKDVDGNLITTGTPEVTLTIAGATFSGTTVRNAEEGAASFSGLKIIGLAGVKTFTVSVASPISLTDTETITLNHGSATQVVVTTAASGAVNRANFTTQPVVSVQDVSGNPVSNFVGRVSVSAVSAGSNTLTEFTGTLFRDLSGTPTATFTDLKLNGKVGNYTLTFATGVLTSATQSITLTHGSAHSLAITGSALAANATNFSSSMVVRILDEDQNTVTTGSQSTQSVVIICSRCHLDWNCNPCRSCR